MSNKQSVEQLAESAGKQINIIEQSCKAYPDINDNPSGFTYNEVRSLQRAAMLYGASCIASQLEASSTSQQTLLDAYMALKAENERLLEANRWVPVSERLPEFLQAVLIWTNVSLDPDRAVFYKKGKWLFQSTNENFFTDKQPHIIITHWQPLPTPPTV